MDTKNINISTNTSAECQQDRKTDFDKTSIAITAIIAGCILTGFIKLIDAKYGHCTTFSFKNDNVHICFGSHTATNAAISRQA